jgi:glycosyltransferase involved in cell wall biosynthesis
MSRLDLKKGCDLLLQGFASVMKGTPWKLIMAGPDSTGWKGRLQSMAVELGIAGQVEWPGMLQGEEKWQAMQQAQALVLPSHQENFGLVIVEALACGTPVLISDRVNIWREIIEEGAGLVAPDTLAGIVELLTRWNSVTQDDKVTMSQAARNCFQKNFEMAGAFRRLNEILQGCLPMPVTGH